MPSILAIVSKKVFEKECPNAVPGSVYATTLYRSGNKVFDRLTDGGDIYLVSVRPEGEQMWLVGVLRSPKKMEGGWVAINATPIADISALRASIRFESGKGISKKEGALGMSLQTPRALSADDVAGLEAMIGGKKKTPKKTRSVPKKKQTGGQRKPETAKRKTTKSEAAKSETAKSETAKSETAKSETAKSETAKSETLTHRATTAIKIRVDEAPTIRYSNEAQKYLWPRTREELAWGPKKKTPKALWKRLSQDYYFNAPEPSESEGAEEEARRVAFLLVKTEPVALDVDWGAILIATLGEVLRNLCCEYLAGRIGLVDTLHALMKSQRWERKTRPHRLLRRKEPGPVIQEALFKAYLGADEKEQHAYVEAVEELYAKAEMRDRLTLLACLPTRSEWANELAQRFLDDGGTLPAASLLMFTVTDPVLSNQLVRTGFKLQASVVNLVPVLGEEAVPILAGLLNTHGEYSNEQKACARALACIGTPKSAATLVAYLRKKNVRTYATEFFARFPHLAEDALSALQKKKTKLGGVAREILENVSRAQNAGDIEVANDDQVPEILRDAPWHRASRHKRKPFVVLGLSVPGEPTALHWPEQSRRRWIAENFKTSIHRGPNACKEFRAKVEAGEKVGLSADYPSDITIPMLENTPPHVGIWDGVPSQVLGFEGSLALRGVLAAWAKRRGNPRPKADVFLHIESPVVMSVLLHQSVNWAQWNRHGPVWAEKYPRAAVAGLLPAAVGEKGALRRIAESMVRYLDRRGHRALIETEAERQGDACVEAVAEVLGADAREECPKKPPKMPTFCRPSELRPPKLKSGKALPLWAVERITEMIRFSDGKWPYVGIDEIRQSCDPKSLAEFAWDLAKAWDTNGAKETHEWMLYAIGHFANDEVVRRLTPALRGGGIGHLLGLIGTDAACLELQTIEARIAISKLSTIPKYAEGARASMKYIAARRGMSVAELADEFAGTYDIDDKCEVVLDLGTKKYCGRFDAQLRPQLLNEKGAPVRNLPVASKVDAALLKVAATRWADLKEDVTALAYLRSIALERAMLDARTWTHTQFRKVWVDHPLVIHFTRATVWTAVDAKTHAPVETFRVAGDRSYATRRDDEWRASEDVHIRVAHPGEWSGVDYDEWVSVFADYELLSPFGQFDRKPASMSDEELASTHITVLPEGERRGVLLPRLGWEGNLQVGQFASGFGQLTRAFSCDTILQFDAKKETEQVTCIRGGHQVTFAEVSDPLRSETRYVLTPR